MTAVSSDAILPASAINLQRGQVWQFGRHRMMCGDATNKEDVEKLFRGLNPSLVVTSPPYAKQRRYENEIMCWHSLMKDALNVSGMAAHVQLLVNLGLVHKNGEYWPYWDGWIAEMKRAGWRFFGKYIWDKGFAIPGNFSGRLAPAHEYIFHLNKASVAANKVVPCSYAGKTTGSRGVIAANNKPRSYRGGRQVHPMKIADSVIRITPERTFTGGHPAVFPLRLPEFLISSWKAESTVVYDPFGGSGTTLLACEKENVLGLSMEISPLYMQIAIERWNRTHGLWPARMC